MRKKEIGVMLLMLLLSGSIAFLISSLKTDKKHATITMVTSAGATGVGESFNGLGYNRSGEQLALKNKSIIKLKKGENVSITFKCEACGNEQQYLIEQPCSEVICCDCPEEGDKHGNAKEYFCLTALFEE